MKMYEAINHILCNYFSMVVECGSPAEGIAALRKDLESNPKFAHDLKNELRNAFVDANYSWKNAFIECQCEILYDEEETEEDEEMAVA